MYVPVYAVSKAFVPRISCNWASEALQDPLELIRRAKAGAIATGVLDTGLR